MRRWSTAAVVLLVVLDVVVLAMGYRARGGHLPPLQSQTTALLIAPASATETTSEPGEDQLRGPVLLGANAEGAVLRAARGACQASFDNPAEVWVGSVEGGPLQLVQIPGLLEVLGLMVYGDSSLRISGLDESCEPATFDSKDGGDTWTTVSSAGIWRLNSDTTADSVIGPVDDDELTLGCAAKNIVNLRGRRATASCASTDAFDLRPNEQPTVVSVPDYSQISITAAPEAGRYYVFGVSGGCDAQVGVVAADAESVTAKACLDDDTLGSRAPLAIATAGDRVIVQVGDDLMVSDDEGETFTVFGA
jgi:hypothetical protein